MSDERWREVSRLYHHAAALAAADRPAYLRKVCADDEALRAEIESLLIENSRVERLLGSEHSRMDFIGRRIGVYEIRSLLGVGGNGRSVPVVLENTKLDRDVGDQDPAAGFHIRSRTSRALRARSASARVAESSAHRGDLWFQEASGVSGAGPRIRRRRIRWRHD